MGIPKCEFIADVIIPRGKGWKRVPDVECCGCEDHSDEHRFLVEGQLSFGVSEEKGKWVSRR